MSKGISRTAAMLAGLLLALIAFQPALSETIGNTTITLHSHRYYAKWDLTRFVYRVKSTHDRLPEGWILGIGDCIDESQIDQAASSSFDWADEPVFGLRFEIQTKNEFFYLWLGGQWDVGSIRAAVQMDSDEWYEGPLDGPLCEGSAISLSVLSGATVEFPQLVGAGAFPAEVSTRLAVTSTSSEWDFAYTPTFLIPERAQRSVVERIFEVSVEPHDTHVGITEILVSYCLNVLDEDYAGLPQGSYVIGVVYTVTPDN